MSSYAITGASKGIALEMVRQLAANTKNTVLAIVRNPDSADISQLGSKHPNVHVIKGDATDPKSMLAAASTAAAITGGKLDVLIHNSNAVDPATLFSSPTQFPFDAQDVRAMFDLPLSTNVYGGLWTTNAFLPLIEKGVQKKIVHLSTGIADIDFIKKTGVSTGVPYSAAKGALNVQVAMYAAELVPKGIKVFALSPGWVDTVGEGKPPQLVEALEGMLKQFQRADPELKGQIQPGESARKCLQAIERAGAELNGLLMTQNGDRTTWF